MLCRVVSACADIPRSRTTDADEESSVAESAAMMSEMALKGQTVEATVEAGGDGGGDGDGAKAAIKAKAEMKNRKRGSGSNANYSGKSGGGQRDKTEFKVPKMMSELISELTAAAVVGGGGGGGDDDSWDLIALENRLRVFQRVSGGGGGGGEGKKGGVS